MDEWAEAARTGFACEPGRLPRAVRRRRGPAARAGRRGRASAAAHSGASRSAIAVLRPDPCRRARRDGVAAASRNGFLPQPPDARGRRPVEKTPERRIGQTAHDFVAALGAAGKRSSAAPKSGAARRPSPRASCSAWAPSRAKPPMAAHARAGRGLARFGAGDRPARGDRTHQAARAAPAACLAPAEPQRHAHRDAATRSLCDLCRIYPEAEAPGADRHGAGSARDRQ